MKKLVSIFTLAIVLVSSTYSQTESAFMNPFKMRVNFIDNILVLEWNSWEEVNTSYFVIEKQVNSKPFEIVATIKAGGATYGVKQYFFEDPELDTSGPTNYRLTLVWMDGTRKSWTMNQDFTAIR